MLTTKKINLTTIVVQSQGNIVSDMDGEKVMMSIKNSKYYNLGKTGGVIWDLISSPISIEEITHKLTAEYEVDMKECETQVINFVDKLVKEGLIQLIV
jgi:hypothetical protein